MLRGWHFGRARPQSLSLIHSQSQCRKNKSGNAAVTGCLLSGVYSSYCIKFPLKVLISQDAELGCLDYSSLWVKNTWINQNHKQIRNMSSTLTQKCQLQVLNEQLIEQYWNGKYIYVKSVSQLAPRNMKSRTACHYSKELYSSK